MDRGRFCPLLIEGLCRQIVRGLDLLVCGCNMAEVEFCVDSDDDPSLELLSVVPQQLEHPESQDICTFFKERLDPPSDAEHDLEDGVAAVLSSCLCAFAERSAPGSCTRKKNYSP